MCTADGAQQKSTGPGALRFARFGVLMLVACLSACSLPDGDQSSPSQLHYKWLKVRATGDAAQMWGLLHPSIRDEFTQWLTFERLMLKEIKSSYPKEDATKAIEAMGGSERGELDSAQSLFQRFLKPAPEVPGTLGEVAAHVRSEELSEDGTVATVRTYGGDEVQFRKGPDGLWYVTLPPIEQERLTAARKRADQNLQIVKANLQKLGRNQP